MKLEAGAKIGDRYRLQERIGRGGMSTVWAAEREDGVRVALKVLAASLRDQATMRQRFFSEARLASSIAHPAIVSVLDVFEEEGAPMIAMELLEGQTLAQRLNADGALPIQQVAVLHLPVLDAVGAAHARGIIHRDLKPANIFLSDKPGGVAPMVLDFGVAKLVDPDDGCVLTAPGTTLGTPAYMAPEQALGEPDLDTRVDVWSLGAVLYHAVSGVRPVEAKSLAQALMRHQSSITPLQVVAPHAPNEVAGLVMAMLSRDRDKRPSSMGVVLEALEKVR